MDPDRARASASGASPHPTRRRRRLRRSPRKRAIAVAGLEPDDIDVILVATLTPDYLDAFDGRPRQGGHRQSDGRGHGRIAAACSGFVFAYAIADAYIRSGMARHVLLIGAELLTRFLDFSDRSTCILFGDGAGAVVVSASDEEGGGLAGVELTTDPDGAYMIWLPSGGSKRPSSSETLARGEHFIRMEGRETYRYATKTLAASALTAIERAGWGADEVDLFIPHQANVRIIEAVAKGLGLPMEKMFVNVDRYGNTSAASVAIALAEAVEAVASRPATSSCSSRSGPASPAVPWRSTGRPIQLDSAALRDVVAEASVRGPVSWAEVDPMPPRLAAVLADPTGPPVPLDDVVPGEPDDVRKEAAR